MRFPAPLLAVALIGAVVALAMDARTASSDGAPQGSVSLFDEIFSRATPEGRKYGVPFPFSRLRSELAARVGLGPSELKEVLLPLGRALQRDAAAPSFYQSPRHVLIVDSDAKRGQVPKRRSAKDRLFIGYQEKARSLEVISYNEAAGRFEFQIVDDYAPGKTPRVRPAERALCVSCHQNEAPIFPEAPWSETGANPDIRKRLLEFGPTFHGMPVRATTQAAEHARAITGAVERANRLAALNIIWRDGCGRRVPDTKAAAECRANMFLLGLLARLSTSKNVDTKSDAYRKIVRPAFLKSWKTISPAGLVIPAHLIPDRDPTELGSGVPRDLDPLTPREPYETWHADRRKDIAKAIVALADTFTEPDVRRLDTYLGSEQRTRGAKRKSRTYPCSFSKRGYFDGKLDRLLFYCTGTDQRGSLFNGYVYFEPELTPRGRVDALQLPNGEHFSQLRLAGDTSPQSIISGDLSVRVTDEVSGLSVRRADGWALESIRLHWEAVITEDFDPSAEIPAYPRNGTATLTFVDDVAVLHRTVIGEMLGAQTAQTLFGDRPFSRGALMAALFNRLGLPHSGHSRARASLPHAPAQPNTSSLTRLPDVRSPLAVLDERCGACHRSASKFPPNFLAGSAHERERKITGCAERIAFRLAMWLQDPDERVKSPMPPPAHFEAQGMNAKAWRKSAELSGLLAHVAGLISDTGGSDPLRKTLQRPYAELRNCLVKSQ